MDGCLACKSCVGGCPIKVNVPGFRAKFLELYHGRYLRPARDYLVASLEHLLPVVARVPRLHNGLLGSGPGGAGMRLFGLVDTPRLSGIDLDLTGRQPGILRSRKARAGQGVNSPARPRKTC